MNFKGEDVSGTGAAVEVQLTDGVWRRGNLAGRLAGHCPPRWKVQLDDGTLTEIHLENPEAPNSLLRFDAGAFRSDVEVRVGGIAGCRRGRLVELVRGSDRWGVAFEDGSWAEDVRLGEKDVQYASAVGGAGKRGRGVWVEGEGGAGAKSRPSVTKEERECKVCGKVFSRLGGLEVHMRSHTGERPFVCSTCGKAFKDFSYLGIHMRIHTGEKQYSCTMCDKAFSTNAVLNRHMRTHSGEKQHVCETCGKGFERRDKFTAHMRTHDVAMP